MTRPESLLHYFVARFSRRLGRTALVKLLYLCDLEARRFLGHPLTNLEWRWHHHGPWSDEIKRARRRLVLEGRIREREVEYELAMAHAAEALDETPDLGDLTPAERAVVESVGDRFGPMPLGRLLQYVYATAPMVAGKRGEPLPMAMVDNEGAGQLGRLDPESIALGLEDVRAGRTVPLEKIERGIRERIRGAGSGEARPTG